MIELLVPQASSYAASIDGLITLITVLVGFWFLIAEGVFFYFIFKFKAKEGQKAQYITGEKGLSVYRWQKDIGVSAKATEDKPGAYAIKQGYWRVDCLLPDKQCSVEEKLPRCAWLTFNIARDAKQRLEQPRIPHDARCLHRARRGKQEQQLRADALAGKLGETVSLGDRRGKALCVRR